MTFIDIDTAQTTVASLIVLGRGWGYLSDQLSTGTKPSEIAKTYTALPPSSMDSAMPPTRTRTATSQFPARTIADYARYAHDTLSQIPVDDPDDPEKRTRLLSALESFPSDYAKSLDHTQRVHLFRDLLLAVPGDDRRSKATQSSIAVLSAWARGIDLEK